MPVDLEELHASSAVMPELQKLRFTMAGFGPVSDWLVMPPVTGMQAVAPRAVKQACSCEEVDGRRGRLALAHPDLYVFTTTSVVAFIMQWLDGTARRPGLHFLGMLAELSRAIAAMQRMGIATRAV